MFGMTGAGGIFHAVSALSPCLFSQSEQYEQSEQSEQPEQPEQPEQREQYEQYEQREQSEQLVQFSQFFRLSSAACAASTEPKYWTEQRLPFASVSQSVVMSLPPLLALAGPVAGLVDEKCVLRVYVGVAPPATTAGKS